MIFKLFLSRIKNLAARVKSVLTDSGGSASVEFSILAIPLFIPLFIFITQFSHSSDAQDSLRTLARESVRAFVSSSNDEIAFGVAEQIIKKGGAILGHENIELRIICSASPCISPDARVLIRLVSRSSTNLKTEVAAIEYVSPWA
jgi:hypothetical protein